MKILFVNPSLRPDAPHRYLPVGLGYIVTCVKEAGFDFDILDVDIGGYSDQQVDAYLAKNNYDVIALGAIVTHYKWVKWFIHTAKKHQPDCKLIVGNSVGSSIPEVIFNHTPADIVVLGEGDVTIVEVLKALDNGKSLGTLKTPKVPVAHTNCNLPPCFEGEQGGVEGIVFRDEAGNIVHNGRRKAVRKIDDLPYPDWDLFDVESYLKRAAVTAHQTYFYPQEEAVVMPINTARGCVFKCTFCHYVYWHDPYRHRSAESIIGEIRRNKEKYGANYINFWDELSFHKLGPAEKFVDAMIEADLGVHWTAAVRSDLFGQAETPYEDRKRVAEKFIKAGNLAVGYSLESGSDEILEAMNKRVKAEYFAEQSRLLRDVGIVINTSVVVGYPQESAETLAQTMGMCEKLHIYPSVGFLLPLPETGMWKYAVDEGYITDPDAFLEGVTERQDIILNMTKMSDDELRGRVLGGLADLNKKFGNKLDEKSLVRTGGYMRHGKSQESEVQRHRNIQDSLNPSKVSGSV